MFHTFDICDTFVLFCVHICVAEKVLFQRTTDYFYDDYDDF